LWTRHTAEREVRRKVKIHGSGREKTTDGRVVGHARVTIAIKLRAPGPGPQKFT